jgi:DNA invertase Pin-like site-specific DNA recombinase
MKNAVAYIRVSTKQQGASGLGLEAQERAIEDYIARSSSKLLATYREVETAKRDTLENRPALRQAISQARRTKAILVIAKLDRLSRSVYVTAELHRSGVEFVACDNPSANRLTIQILAAVAEDEARRISERTKSALAAYKARGGLLGGSRRESRNLTDEARANGTEKSRMAIQTACKAAYEDLLPLVSGLKAEGLSLRGIARYLNKEGHLTRNGCEWNAAQVRRVLSLAS